MIDWAYMGLLAFIVGIGLIVSFKSLLSDKRRGISGREGIILFGIAMVIAAIVIFVVWPMAGTCVWNSTPGSVGQC